MTAVATVLPRTILYEVGPAAVCRDADGTTWCGLCMAESCKHTAAVASAIASGTAPAPVRRKASGGKRTGAGRPNGSLVGTDEERFWANVRKRANGCWIWKRGTHGNPQSIHLNDERVVAVHRWAYEFLVGPIPTDLVIDHLCAVPKCVNPEHLEAVTSGENLRRGGLPHFEMRGLHSARRQNSKPALELPQ